MIHEQALERSRQEFPDVRDRIRDYLDERKWNFYWRRRV